MTDPEAAPANTFTVTLVVDGYITRGPDSPYRDDEPSEKEKSR